MRNYIGQLNSRSNIFSPRTFIFVAAFASIGTAVILIIQAATTTQTFSGKLTTRQTSQNFSIASEGGQLNATLASESTANIKLSLVNSSGTIVATQTGPSPLAISSITQPGSYFLQVSSPDPISSKGLPFSLQVIYSQADTSAPSAPANLSATPSSGNSISLNWGASTDNIGVTGYDVYRNSVKVATASNNTYQDNNLTPLTTYKYYVIAKDAAGNSSKPSTTIRVKTLAAPSGDTTPPTTPTNLSAAANGYSRVDLNWTASTDNSGIAPHYDIYVNGALKYPNVTQPPYNDYSITSGSTYVYYVVARDDVGNLSQPSNTVSVTMPIPDTEKPTAPTNLTGISTNSKQITLNWDPSTDNIAVTGYTIFVNGVQWSSVSSNSFTHSFLTPSTNYSYYVVARDAANNISEPSSTVTIKTRDPDTERPTAPSNFTVTATSSNQVDLSWGASTDNVGVIGYRIFRNDLQLASLSNNTNTYTDASVVPSKAYSYRVEAFDADGNYNSATTRRIYTPSAINISISSPSSGTTQSGTITVSGTASSSSGQVSKVEIAGSYGNYQPVSGTSNWTANFDTTKILDSTTPVYDDPTHPEPINRYIFVKATDTVTGDFKITTLPIIIKNDNTLPTATVTSPVSGSSQAGIYTLTGTASDNVGVKKVEIKNDSGQGGVVLATGTTNWTATVTTANDSFYPFNTVVVYDVNGNISKTPFTVNRVSQTYNGSISGKAYKDIDNNGLFEQGDQALTDITIYLYATSPNNDGYGQYMKNVKTDAQGQYSFSGLQDGHYTIRYNTSNWWDLYDNWVSNNPAVNSRTFFSPAQTVQLSGSAVADFSWRKVNRTPDPNNSGAFLRINSFAGPSGLTAEQHDDYIPSQEIYDRTMAGKLIGNESQKTRVSEGYRFGGGFAGTTSAGYTIDNLTGKCTDPSGASGVYWPYWYDSDEGTLFHEYGHSWQNYWSCLNQDLDLVEYMKQRGVELTDPRIGTNHEWSLKEIAAEDYRQLFSADPKQERQENRYIPRATEIPGFKDFLINSYRTAR